MQVGFKIGQVCLRDVFGGMCLFGKGSDEANQPFCNPANFYF